MHSTAPLSEFRLKMRFFIDLMSFALAICTKSPFSFSILILVPAVTYKPASTVQPSAKGNPMPALAPIKQFSPTDTNSVPPPERVPIVLELPPRSLPFETITPAEILPRSLQVPMCACVKIYKSFVHYCGATPDIRSKPNSRCIGDSDSRGDNIVCHLRKFINRLYA